MSRSIDINIDAKCSAECKHCCFSCSSTQTEALSDFEIDSILNYIDLNRDIKTVAITGGEPLLRLEKVKEIYMLSEIKLDRTIIG